MAASAPASAACLVRATASDANNPDSLSLCIEVDEIGTAFSNTEDSCGSSVAYSGGSLPVEHTITGLTNGAHYHWQARIKDGGGLYSSWLSFGGNAESANDFSIDTSAPTGTVYDGSTTGVDIDLNNGSLDTLSANWNIDSSTSGLVGYEYSIGTSLGATDIVGWTDNGTTDNFTESSLNLNTSQPYYVNVRTTDNAGNQSTISSDGIFVSPTLSFSSAPSSVTFDNLNSSNSYTDTETSILTTSTNAYQGYQIRAYITAVPTSANLDVISLFDGGTYAVPDEWLGGDTGYGYTSNDTTIEGSNLFGSTPCAGGGNPPCYAPFSLTPPGDIVADHTDLITGTPVSNENFVITHRVTVNANQPAGTYITEVIYSVIARY